MFLLITTKRPSNRPKLKTKSLYLLIYLIHTGAYAQYQQMLHKPYKDKVGDIAILYKNTIQNYVEDSVSVKDFTVEMKKWALANDDQELALEAELLMAYSKWHVYGYKKPELIKELIDVADKAEKQKHANCRWTGCKNNSYSLLDSQKL